MQMFSMFPNRVDTKDQSEHIISYHGADKESKCKRISSPLFICSKSNVLLINIVMVYDIFRYEYNFNHEVKPIECCQ